MVAQGWPRQVSESTSNTDGILAPHSQHDGQMVRGYPYGGPAQLRPTWASAATASATPAACDSPTRPPPPGSG